VDQREGSPRSLSVTWAGVMFAPGAIITGMVAAGGEAVPGFVYGFLGIAIGVMLGMLGLALISMWAQSQASPRCRWVVSRSGA